MVWNPGKMGIFMGELLVSGRVLGELIQIDYYFPNWTKTGRIEKVWFLGLFLLNRVLTNHSNLALKKKHGLYTLEDSMKTLGFPTQRATYVFLFKYVLFEIITLRTLINGSCCDYYCCCVGLSCTSLRLETYEPWVLMVTQLRNPYSFHGSLSHVTRWL